MTRPTQGGTPVRWYSLIAHGSHKHFAYIQEITKHLRRRDGTTPTIGPNLGFWTNFRNAAGNPEQPVVPQIIPQERDGAIPTIEPVVPQIIPQDKQDDPLLEKITNIR